MFTDFHNHALPDIDDGAADFKESLEMLKMSSRQNVKRIVFTPHFYKDQNLAFFLRKRKASYGLIRKTLSSKIQFQLGAEVLLEKNISNEVDLAMLTIDGSRYIMIELPYFSFEDWIDQELHNILYKHKLIPIFTNIDRYALTYPKDKYEKILSTPGAVFQFNVKAFSDPNNIKTVKKLISQDKIVLLGSNAHNMSTRMPNFDILDETLGKAMDGLSYNYLIIQNNRFLKPQKQISKSFSTDISAL